MKTVQIKKWGNSKGVLLPKTMLDMLSLKTDDSVDIEVIDQKIIISPIKNKRPTLADRFKGFEGEKKQVEYWNDDPIGKEIF